MWSRVAEPDEELARVRAQEARMARRSSECPQVLQGAKAGQKEVSAANWSNKSLDDRLLTHRLRRNAEGTLGTEDWVAFVVAQAKHRIQQPGVLDELELAFNLAVH